MGTRAVDRTPVGSGVGYARADPQTARVLEDGLLSSSMIRLEEMIVQLRAVMLHSDPAAMEALPARMLIGEQQLAAGAPRKGPQLLQAQPRWWSPT